MWSNGFELHFVAGTAVLDGKEPVEGFMPRPPAVDVEHSFIAVREQVGHEHHVDQERQTEACEESK